MFTDRFDAGKKLSLELSEQLAKRQVIPASDTVVIGLPRGGVIVAIEVARALGCALDIFVSKKMRAPDYPEMAIGAVSSTGVVLEDERILRFVHDPQLQKEYLQAQKTQRAELIEQTKASDAYYRQLSQLPKTPVFDKRVIVVDDGIATGMTAAVTLQSLRQQAILDLVLAAPVIAESTKADLSQICDLVVAPIAPNDFQAVGQHYEDFHQVTDEEMIEALKQFALARAR